MTALPVLEDEVHEAIDLLELEVRRLDGVVSVSIGRNDDSNLLTVVAPGVGDEDGLRRSIAQLTRTYSDEPFTIDLDLNRVIEEADGANADQQNAETPEEAEISRPMLDSVSIEGEMVKVALHWDDRTGQGEASARTLNHAAEATLLALDDLGVLVPFYVRSVTPLGTALRDAVVVVLRSSEAAEERFGVATGDSAREATVRATLDALNRYISHAYPKR